MTIKYFDKLSNNQKKFFSYSVALLIGTGLLGTFIYLNNPQGVKDYLNSFGGSKNTQSDTTAKELEISGKVKDARDTLQKLDLTNDFYQTIKLEDLKVYPQSWVNRNFSTQEQRNELISGPLADPSGSGLSNQQKYFYGANPKLKNSLCVDEKTKLEFGDKCKKNDKELVDANISPLTGLDLETPKTFRILKQDKEFAENMQSSLESASEEGVDFPVLYQLSQKIDLTDQLEKIKIDAKKDDRENLVKYLQLRFEILDDFLEQDSLSTFTQIYQLKEAEKMEPLKMQYQNQLKKLQEAVVPQRYEKSHRAYIFLHQKFIELIEFRQKGIQENKASTEEFRQKGIQENKASTEEFRQQSKDKAVEIIWAYNQLNKENDRVESVKE